MYGQLHFNICKEIGTKLDNETWYDHVQKLVEISCEGKVTILWNQQVQTKRTISNYKQDNIICDIEKGICMLINDAISADRNVIKKEAEKILKYKNCTMEVQHMWIVKAKVIPVIIGVTGTISKSLRQYLSKLPGKYEIKELQKTAILGTANKLWEMLM